MRRRAWGAACLGRPWSRELSSAQAARAGPGGELGREDMWLLHGTFPAEWLQLILDLSEKGKAAGLLCGVGMPRISTVFCVLGVRE